MEEQRAYPCGDCEPDYDAHIAEMVSLEETMANVGDYDDWFSEEITEAVYWQRTER